MSELKSLPRAGLVVSAVASRSAAQRAGIQVGDSILSVNGSPVADIVDFRFHASEDRFRIELERAGAIVEVPASSGDGSDFGLDFEDELADRVHTCKNKCVFCFIHQMPKKMRRSLYVMDDDFRLSFMHGHYVTLTNLTDSEWNRILEQKLSPLYVSVHATDPDLRQRLLGRRDPCPILPQLEMLAQNRISVHAQIVLCPGLNDGEALVRSLGELAGIHPASSGRRAGVESVAIVPVGMTRFRERLPSLTHVERDYARSIVAEVEKHAVRFRKQLGTRFVWAADEWYTIGGLPIPAHAHYEEFPQLEDGIGTLRLFMDEHRQLARSLPKSAAPVKATLVTAEMPAPYVTALADTLNGIAGVDIGVCTVKNDFFGGDIHIAGLITGTDIIAQAGPHISPGAVLVIPEICLRDRTLFLDDLTVGDVASALGVEVRVSGTSPKSLAACLEILHSPGARRRDLSAASSLGAAS